MLHNRFHQIKNLGRGGRSGIFNTRRGAVKTPFFMPVATRGAIKGLEPTEVAAAGTAVLLANTYHLHLQPGEKTIKKLGGLHNFSGWRGPILTDSGGFQVFSLSHVRKITEDGVLFKDPKSGVEVFITPEKSMQIQLALGADIIMAFDDLTGLAPGERGRTQEAVERTHRWLLRSITEFKKLTKGLKENQRPLLFGIQQGGLNKKLRQKSLEFVQSTDVDGVAIGGLSVGEPRPQMHGMLDFLAPLYDPARIHYLMGIGEPIDMRHAIERGIDMFDCVLPTRNGRHGSVWLTDTRKMNLKNEKFKDDSRPIDPGEIEFDESNSSAKGGISRGQPRGTAAKGGTASAGSTGVDKKCDCYTCKTGYSRAFLRQLFKNDDPLGGKLASIHNLRYLNRLCEEYQSI